MDERAPLMACGDIAKGSSRLSDDELIARIEATEPLPDADNDAPAWLDDATWDRAEFRPLRPTAPADR